MSVRVSEFQILGHLEVFVFVGGTFVLVQDMTEPGFCVLVEFETVDIPAEVIGFAFTLCLRNVDGFHGM